MSRWSFFSAAKHTSFWLLSAEQKVHGERFNPRTNEAGRLPKKCVLPAEQKGAWRDVSNDELGRHFVLRSSKGTSQSPQAAGRGRNRGVLARCLDASRHDPPGLRRQQTWHALFLLRSAVRGEGLVSSFRDRKLEVSPSFVFGTYLLAMSPSVLRRHTCCT